MLCRRRRRRRRAADDDGILLEISLKCHNQLKPLKITLHTPLSREAATGNTAQHNSVSLLCALRSLEPARKDHHRREYGCELRAHPRDLTPFCVFYVLYSIHMYIMI